MQGQIDGIILFRNPFQVDAERVFIYTNEMASNEEKQLSGDRQYNEIL